MKNLVKSLSVIAMIVLSQAVSAQDTKEMMKKTPEERAQFQTQWMQNQLGLNSDQVSRISAVNLKYAKINEPVLKGSDGKFSKLKQLKANQKSKERELKGVFTPEQFTRYLSVQDEMKDKMKNRKSK